MYLNSFLKTGNQYIYYRAAILVMILTLFSNCNTKSSDNEVQFWKWFEANDERLYQQTESREKLFNDLIRQLHKVDTNLTFVFSTIHTDGIRDFTIFADGIY